MEKEHLAEVACQSLNLPCPEPDLDEWRTMIDAWKHPEKEVTIALVGKYIQLHDAYISVVEALKHGGVANRAKVNIKWIDSETVTRENAAELLGDVSGILVQAVSEAAVSMVRSMPSSMQDPSDSIPWSLPGMQLSIVEFARDVVGFTDAHSEELDPSTTHPVIHLMPDQNGVENIGGTLRLGSYPCVLNKSSKAYALYGEELIHERHRPSL